MFSQNVFPYISRKVKRSIFVISIIKGYAKLTVVSLQMVWTIQLRSSLSFIGQNCEWGDHELLSAYFTVRVMTLPLANCIFCFHNRWGFLHRLWSFPAALITWLRFANLTRDTRALNELWYISLNCVHMHICVQIMWFHNVLRVKIWLWKLVLWGSAFNTSSPMCAYLIRVFFSFWFLFKS